MIKILLLIALFICLCLMLALLAVLSIFVIEDNKNNAINKRRLNNEKQKD